LSFQSLNYRLCSVKHPRSRPGRFLPGLIPSSIAALATLTVFSGCSSTTAPATGDLALDLNHPDARVRIRATRGVYDQNRMDLVPKLVENLSDRDEAVRMFTSVGLRKLTGKDFGYNPGGPPEERIASIQRWKEWLHSAGFHGTIFQGTMESPGPSPSFEEKDAPPPGTALKGNSEKESLPGTRDG